MRYLLFLLIIPILTIAQDHLLITEVYIPPSGDDSQAFIEIYNPTDQSVNLSNYYLADYNTYYQVVQYIYNSKDSDFIVRFPSESQVHSKETIVVALNGDNFESSFTKQADYQIKGVSDAIDMVTFQDVSQAKLESQEIVILFYWDGQSDLVQDVDYVNWSLFLNLRVDKTGIRIEGPNADGDSSEYQPDTAVEAQSYLSATLNGTSFQRSNVNETDEINAGGNGITGHNETSENFQSSFYDDAPTPGHFSENPGDGTGTASVHPTEIELNTLADISIEIAGTSEYVLTRLQIIIPPDWTWSQNASDVQFSGEGSSGATLTVSADTIRFKNMQITNLHTAKIILKNLTSPPTAQSSEFEIKTAVTGGILTKILVQPVVQVANEITIKKIIENFDDYNGQIVTFEAVVAIGAGVTRTDRTDTYIQDASERGINLSDAGTNFPDLVRGNRIRITGEVSEYQGDPQIKNFSTNVISTGNAVPGVQIMSVAEASDLSIKGTMVETVGIIRDIFTIGGGTNITINDGSNSVVIRAWETTGIDISRFNIGDTLGVRAVIDEYENAPQLLVGYEDDLFPGKLKIFAAGSGIVTALTGSVGKEEQVGLQFRFEANSEDTVRSMSITVPSYWSWTQNASDVQTGGSLAGSSVEVNGPTIMLNNFNVVKPETGEILINGLTAPPEDTASVFLFKTGSQSSAMSEIRVSPVILVGNGTSVPTIPIAEARKNNPGDRVSVKGVVVIGAGILRSGQTSAYIQDNSNRGINIFDFDEDENMKRGNLVIVSGILEEYTSSNRDKVLEITDYTARVLKTNSDLPEPVKLSPFQAKNLDPNEFEGTWVEVDGQISKISTDDYGTNLEVYDNADFVIIRINSDTGIRLDNMATWDYIRVNGVVGTYRQDIQILPGYQEDIEIYDPALKPDKDLVELNVPNKPFVPEAGEKLKIEYTVKNNNSHITIRIFDLGGRMITTLFDGPPYEIDLDWNGRDAINELVSIGTYICHLEVVDNDSGQRQTKVAPIVVGTVLSR